MAMIVLSSPATLAGAEEKKTGPSRFRSEIAAVRILKSGTATNWVVAYFESDSLGSGDNRHKH
jgi:hypothetical protein